MIRASLVLKPRDGRPGAAPARPAGDAARVIRYETLKTHAQSVAAKATRNRSEPYLMLASSWITLAEELERLTRKTPKA
jgi:hypothetical protein